MARQADPMLYNIVDSHGEHPTFLRSCSSEKPMGPHSPLYTLSRVVRS